MSSLSEALKRIGELEHLVEDLAARIEALEDGGAEEGLAADDTSLTDVEILNTVCEQLDGIEAHMDRVIRVHRDGKPSVRVVVTRTVVNGKPSWGVEGQVEGAAPKHGNGGDTLFRACYILSYLPEPSDS